MATYSQVANGSQQNHLLYKATDLISDYLKEYSVRKSKVLEFKQPDELRKLIDFKLGDDGMDDDSILALVEKAVKYSIHTGHPHFYNQLWSGVNMYGLVGSMVTAATNTSMYTYEMAPVYCIMEKECISQMLSLAGFPGGEGILCPGGSISNLLALTAARHRRFPRCKTEGICGLPPLVIFASSGSHYSILKSAATMGMGTNNVIKVKTDEMDRMLPTDLDVKIRTALKEGKHPIAVVATSGTTVVGAFDPLNEIADVCERHGIWLHIDAAWGGSVLVSDKHRHLMDGSERADSITWDSHKMLTVPLYCSALLVRHKGLLTECNSAHATYLFQKDKVAYDTSLDTGDMTIQCGRINDALKIWIMWKAMGRKGFENHIDKAFERAGYLAERVKVREGFELLWEPESLNVCFYYIPPSMRSMPRTDEWKKKLNKVAPVIKSGMMHDGTMMIGYQPLNDHPNFFRMIVTSPTATFEDMDYVLNEIERLGKSIK